MLEASCEHIVIGADPIAQELADLEKRVEILKTSLELAAVTEK